MSAAVDSRRRAVLVGRVGVLGVGFAAWLAAAALTDLVAPVGATFESLRDGLGDGGWLWEPLGMSLRAALGGFLIAALSGVAVGVLLGGVRPLWDIFHPIVTGLFGMPRILLYPVILTIFGITAKAQITMAAIAAFFPIAIICTAAIRDVSPIHRAVGRAFACNRRQMITKIVLPAVAPSAVSALRLGFSVAFVNVVIVEFFAAENGLGVVMSESYAIQDLPTMFAVMVVVFVIALTVNLLLWQLERALRQETRQARGEQPVAEPVAAP